jgi:hypothetical protein
LVWYLSAGLTRGATSFLGYSRAARRGLGRSFGMATLLRAVALRQRTMCSLQAGTAGFLGRKAAAKARLLHSLVAMVDEVEVEDQLVVDAIAYYHSRKLRNVVVDWRSWPIA